MPADPLILSYARPSSGADAPADATVFTFASPPVRMQFAFVATCFVTCALGAAVVIGIGLDAYFNERRRSDGTVFGCLFGLAVIAAIAFVVYREVKRIRLAGDREVCLEVKEKTLLAWSPQQWGLEPRSLAIEAIRGISAHSAESVVGGVPIYQIHIRRARWLTTYWAIRVAVADAGVIKRSIADLNAAIERARRAADAQLPDNPGGE